MAAAATWACVALACMNGPLARPAFAQGDADRAAARAAATEGLRAFQEGRFQDAVDLCSRAESLMHAPTHLLLVARAQAKLGHLVEAQEAYFRIKRDHLAADAPRAFVDAQASANEEQAALGPRIPTLKVTLEGALAKDVTLTIDGQSVPSALIGLARPINPGQHTLAARSPTAESESASITVAEGATQSLTLALHPVASASPAPLDASSAAPAQAPEQGEAGGGGGGLRIGGWIGVGVGVVGAAVGTAFLLKNRSDTSSANSLCGPKDCPQSQQQQIQNLDSSASQAGTLAWVSYGVGAAALGAGITMLVMSGSSGSKSAPHAAAAGAARPSGGRGPGLGSGSGGGGGGATVWVGPASAGVTLRF